MRLVYRLFFPTCLLAFCLIALAMKVADPPGQQMETFATAFLDTLDESQKADATMPYDSDKRVDWHFIPKKTRKGLVLNRMNDSQKTAALRMLRAALSEAGYDKADKIMMLENALFILEGSKRNWDRDPNKYYVTIFGTPSAKDSWGLSFEGHHLSLNFVCRDGKLVDSTPQFFAANPATIMNEVKPPSDFQLAAGTSVPQKGTRVLRDEEEYAFALVQSFDDDQKKTAIIAEKAPAEIRFAGDPQADVEAPAGIAYSDLNPEQRKSLENLVHTYIDAVADPVAEKRRESIEKNGWQNVHFAWAGATKPGIGHYYRIRGKDFLIEFVNTQPDAAGNPANHIHAVLRDLTGDFDLPPAS